MKLHDFPSQTYDKPRFSDADRQGHVNNAVFATFFETGRIAAMAAAGTSFSKPGFSVVLVRICIDYKKEVQAHGTVEIGTAVKAIGGSSATFTQALFQNGVCVAAAESVLVQLDNATRRSAALDEETKARLRRMLVAGSSNDTSTPVKPA